MERSSVELVVDEFADLVDIWDEVLKKYFYFRSIWTHIMGSFQGKFFEVIVLSCFTMKLSVKSKPFEIRFLY